MWWGMGEKHIFGKTTRWGKDLFVVLSPGCIIHRRLKITLCLMFLCGQGALVLFPLGFRFNWVLSGRVAVDVVALLSLLESHPFRFGRRNVRI